MADMELVIKIGEAQYEFISNGMSIDKVMTYPLLMQDMCERIANGTPLPKGHGRIGDLDKIKKEEEIKVKTTICNINLKEYSDKITAADCKKHGFDQRNIIKRATLAYNMLHERKMSDTNNKILAFIANFFYTAAMRVVHQCRDSIEYSAAWEASNNLYRAGYCYHFANILKATFKRGEVVWLAPFSHCGWQDIDGKVYDAEGYYEGEAFYAIPESYCEDIIIGFSHKDGIPDTKYYSREELISAVKEYCKKSSETYQPDIENWFKFWD